MLPLYILIVIKLFLLPHRLRMPLKYYVCLLLLLHCTCHVSITHVCTENPTFVLSFIYMCDIIWPPAPFKSCYLARYLKEVARACITVYIMVPSHHGKPGNRVLPFPVGELSGNLRKILQISVIGECDWSMRESNPDIMCHPFHIICLANKYLFVIQGRREAERHGFPGYPDAEQLPVPRRRQCGRLGRGRPPL